MQMKLCRPVPRALHFCKPWVALFCALALPSVAIPAPSDAHVFVDSAGRRVTVATHIERVYAAGPPAAIFLYTLAPERLIGWNRPLRPDEEAFMPERYARLPVLGRLTGRANTASLEAMLKTRPQLILDYGSLSQTYVSLADRVQAQTGVPYVLIDGSFKSIARAYRLLGGILDLRERAEQLARYAEQTQAEVTSLLQKVPADHRPRVYYARRADGLETGLGGSINVELLELVGAVNVAGVGGERGGLTSISMEQILN
jgi:iron complex transport system substrate-binding protein